MVAERASDGSFKMTCDDEEEEERDELNSEVAQGSSVDVTGTSCGVSQRQKKKRERLRRFGFIVDDNPDFQVANVTKGVYLGWALFYHQKFILLYWILLHHL